MVPQAQAWLQPNTVHLTTDHTGVDVPAGTFLSREFQNPVGCHRPLYSARAGAGSAGDNPLLEYLLERLRKQRLRSIFMLRGE